MQLCDLLLVGQSTGIWNSILGFTESIGELNGNLLNWLAVVKAFR